MATNKLRLILRKIGFSQKEAAVYLSLLEIKVSAVSTISKKTGIARSSTHMILGKLEQKNLVKHFKKNGITFFQALDPSNFLEKEKQKIQDFNHSLSNLEESVQEILKRHEEYLIEPEIPLGTVDEIAENVVEIIGNSFSAAVGLMLCDEDEKKLKLFKVSRNTKSGKMIMHLLKNTLENLTTPCKDSINLSGECIEKRKIIVGEDLVQFTYPTISKNIARKMQKFGNFKKIVTAPIYTKKRPIGILIVCFDNKVNIEKKIEKLEKIAKNIAVNIENANQFENLTKIIEKQGETLKKYDQNNKKIKGILSSLMGKTILALKSIRKNRPELLKLIQSEVNKVTEIIKKNEKLQTNKICRPKKTKAESTFLAVEQDNKKQE